MAVERLLPPAHVSKARIRDPDGNLHYSEYGPLLGLDAEGTVLVRGRTPIPDLTDRVKEVLFSLPERRDIRGKEHRGFNIKTMARVLDIPVRNVRPRMNAAIIALDKIEPQASITIGFDPLNGYYKTARGPEKVLEQDDLDDHFRMGTAEGIPLAGVVPLVESSPSDESYQRLPVLRAEFYKDGLRVSFRQKGTKQTFYGESYLPIAVYLLRHPKEVLKRRELHEKFPTIPNAYSFAAYLIDVKKFLEEGLGFEQGALIRQTMGRSSEFELRAHVLWDVISQDEAPFPTEHESDPRFTTRFIDRTPPEIVHPPLPLLHVEEQDEGILVMTAHSGEYYERAFSGTADQAIARYILLRPNQRLSGSEVHKVYPRETTVRRALEEDLGFERGALIRTGTGRYSHFELAADVTWSNGTPKDIPLVGNIVLQLEPQNETHAETRTPNLSPTLRVSERDGELRVTVERDGIERTKTFVNYDQIAIAKQILSNAGTDLTFGLITNAIPETISKAQVYRVKTSLNSGLGFPKDTLFTQQRHSRRSGMEDTFTLQAQVVFDQDG